MTLWAAVPGRWNQAVGQETISQHISITDIIYDDGWQTPLRNPSAIFYDRRSGEVFVADAGNSRVLIYDSQLNFKYSFVHYVKERSSDRTIKGEPRDMAVNSLGEIILIDNLADYVEVLDFRGKSLQRVYLNRLYGDSTLSIRPQSVTIDDDDNVYVAASGDVATVMVLDKYFGLHRKIGQKGGEPADFSSPMAVFVAEGKLYVTDLYATPAIKVFDTLGQYLLGFGAHDIERTDVSFPSGVAILRVLGDQPLIWIVDGLRQVIKVYDSRGEFVEHVGGFGLNPGEFRYPAGIAAAGDSLFFVVERVGNRIQRFEIR